MKNQRIDIERLVHNKILGLLSEEEEAQLNRWLSQSEKNREDFNRMMKPADLADRYHHYPRTVGEGLILNCCHIIRNVNMS